MLLSFSDIQRDKNMEKLIEKGTIEWNNQEKMISAEKTNKKKKKKKLEEKKQKNIC